MNVTLLGREFSADTEQGQMVAELNADPNYGGLAWSCSFGCHGQDFDGEWWQPEFTVQTGAFEVRDWRNLEGQKGYFVGGGSLTETKYCAFEEASCEENRFFFAKRRGKVFTIQLDGSGKMAKMTCDDDQFTRIPLQALVDVTFDCLSVRLPDREKADAAVQKFLDLTCLAEPTEWRVSSGAVFTYLYKPLDT